MALAGYEEQGDLPSSQAPDSEFHDFINSQPNFRSKQRWEQEQYAASWLNAASPKFRQLQSTDPLRNYKITEFLDQALQQTPGEKLQHAAEEWGPPALAGVASLAAGPAGIVPAAIAAGGAGAAGELIPQLRPLTTGETPPPWSESLKNAAETGVTYPLIDAATHGVTKGVAAASRRMFVPEADDAGRQMGLEALREHGANPTLTQRGAGPVMQQIQSLGDAAMPGRGFGVRQQRTVDDAVASLTLDTITKATGVIRSDAEMADAFLKESDNLRGIYQQEASRRYQVVDELTQNQVGVNMRPAMNLTALGYGPGRKYPGMNAAGQTRTITDSPATAELFRQFRIEAERDPTTFMPLGPGYAGHDGFFALANSMNKGQTSFRDAQRMSSELKRIARENSDNIDPIKRDAGQLATRMARSVDGEMDNAANSYTQQSVQALVAGGVPLAQAQAQVRDFATEYKNAKQFYKENIAETFENETFRGLAESLKNEPAMFSRLAVAADKPGKLKALREAAPNLWPDMQARVLRSIVEDATVARPHGLGMELDELISKGAVKQISGEKLMNKFRTLGQDYVKELTQGQVNIDDMRKLGAAIEVAEQRPEGMGKVVLMAWQGGALVNLGMNLAGGGIGNPWQSVGVLVTPNVLSLALSRKGVLNMMERGLLEGPKSEAFAKFNAFAFSEYIKELHSEIRDSEAVTAPANQLTKPVGPALSQAPVQRPLPTPNIPEPPRLGQQRVMGMPPR